MTRWTAVPDRPDGFRADYGNLDVQLNNSAEFMLQYDGTFKSDFLYIETEKDSDTLSYEDAVSLSEALVDFINLADDVKEKWKADKLVAQEAAKTEKFKNAGIGTVIQQTNDGLGNFTGRLFVNIGNNEWVSETNHAFYESKDFLIDGLLKHYEFIKD